MWFEPSMVAGVAEAEAAPRRHEQQLVADRRVRGSVRLVVRLSLVACAICATP